MGKIHICNTCNKEFKSLEGLNQHKSDKHPVIEKKKFKINYMYVALPIIFIIIFLIGLVAYMTFQDVSECKSADVLDLSIKDHSSVTEHNHAELRIFIDGVEKTIPSSVGVTSSLMRPLHTHEGAGEIHIEGPCKRTYVLGDFFKIWNAQFNSSCVLDNCGGQVTMTVNGKKNDEFENLILRDDQDIKIEYVSKNE